jgi:hypothetical protein
MTTEEHEQTQDQRDIITTSRASTIFDTLQGRIGYAHILVQCAISPYTFLISTHIPIERDLSNSRSMEAQAGDDLYYPYNQGSRACKSIYKTEDLRALVIAR